MIALGGSKTDVWSDNLTIREGCDLRASLMEEKLPPLKHTEWCMMVNRRGSLAHIVHGGTGVYIRMPAKGGAIFKHPGYCRTEAVRTLSKCIRDLPKEVWA